MTDRRGFLKISRKFFEEDPFWTEDRARTRAEAWLDFLYLAAYRARTQLTGDGPVTLDRGQLLASYRFLATRWKWSVKQVRGWVEVVQKRAMVRALRETRSGTVYTIVNYEFYQGVGTETGIGEGIDRAHQGHSKGTNKKKERSKAVKTITWLTPFADAWSQRCGSPPYGQLAGALGPLRETHEEPEVLRRFLRYLADTDPKYCSANRFASTFHSWGGPEEMELTDDFGAMRLHRKNAVSGEWEAVS